MNDQTVINARRIEAAQRLGIDVSKVRIHRLELKQLREAGLLIDLDISGISMFSVKTSFAELGISGDDARINRMRAGRKDLFPKSSKKLRSLEQRARQNLDKHSHMVPAFGSYRWLPWTAYESFREQHESILAQLEEVKADIIARWDDVYEQNREFFAKAADRAWRALLGQYSAVDEVIITTNSGPTFSSLTGRDLFIEYLVDKALTNMPSPAAIEALVKIDYKTSVLYADSEIAAEDVETTRIAAEIAMEHARQAQAERVLFEMKLEENSEQAKIEAFKAAEMEHAREQLAVMGSPLQDALDSLRSNLYSAVQTLLAGLRKNDGFKGRSSTKAATLYHMWQKLNGGLLEDEALEEALETLNAEMTSYKAADSTMKSAHVGEVISQLAEIATLTVESSRKMSRKNSRAAALEF